MTLPPSVITALRSAQSPVFMWLMRLFALFGVISLGIVIYGVYIEQPLLHYQNLPFPVETPVEQGRTIPMVIERCSDSSEEFVYLATRSLRNLETNKSVILPNSTISVKPGCHRGTVRSAVVPFETEPGRYVLEGTVLMRGLLREHKFSWYTEPFDVIPTRESTKRRMEENEADRVANERRLP